MEIFEHIESIKESYIEHSQLYLGEFDRIISACKVATVLREKERREELLSNLLELYSWHYQFILRQTNSIQEVIKQEETPSENLPVLRRLKKSLLNHTLEEGVDIRTTINKLSSSKI